MASQHDHTVIDLLLQQHQQVRQQFAIVQKATGHNRTEAFDKLRHLLAVHETAEEEILHPFARTKIGNGARIIEARLKEENQAKDLLKQLENLDPDTPEFQTLLDRLQHAVEEHAEREETVEFPAVLDTATPEQLKGMATAVRAAEAVAPTHPHPGTETPLKHLTTGPLTSIIDHAKDAIHKATS